MMTSESNPTAVTADDNKDGIFLENGGVDHQLPVVPSDLEDPTIPSSTLSNSPSRSCGRKFLCICGVLVALIVAIVVPILMLAAEEEDAAILKSGTTNSGGSGTSSGDTSSTNSDPIDLETINENWQPDAQVLQVAGPYFQGAGVALSADGKRIAFGLPDTNSQLGKVHVWDWNDANGFGEWFEQSMDQTPATMVIPAQSSFRIVMSSNGNRIAISSQSSEDRAGRVRVFEWEASLDEWVQLGSGIKSPTADDGFGESLSLSSDGNRLAVGSPKHDETFTLGLVAVGKVQVYELEAFSTFGRDWKPLGEAILGDSGNEAFGSSVSFAADGSRLAVGAKDHRLQGESPFDISGDDAGIVRIYDWLSGADSDASAIGTWIQAGNGLRGASPGDHFGTSVALSEDGQRLIVGATQTSAPSDQQFGSNTGYAYVYEWRDFYWTELGARIPGRNTGDAFGTSVAISASGSRVVIGADQGGEIDTRGEVTVMDYSTSQGIWLPAGLMFSTSQLGDARGDAFGYSVAISANGKMVIGGAQGTNTVRVFEQ